MPLTGIARQWRRLQYRLLRWLRWGAAHVPPRNYQIIVAIIIGIVAGLVAVSQKFLIRTVREWLTSGDPSTGRWGLVFYPMVGIILTVIFVRFLLRRPLDSGLGKLIQSVSRKQVNLPTYETYAHAVGSSLTVGFGGSVGLEAPIIRTGSAIGANLARLLGVGRRKQTLLLACGAAAGMAAIFNSPVAAVIFAFEVLITDIALPSFIPLLIAAATGAVVAKILYYEQIFFLRTGDWQVEAIPFYMLLGIICGLMSVYMTRMTTWLVDRWEQWLPRGMPRLVLGGLAIGVLVFLMPPLFGEGYETVNGLLLGQTTVMLEGNPFYALANQPYAILLFALCVLLAKAMATAITIASGGVGGRFAPTLFTGAVLGFVFAYGVNLSGLTQLREANFIAVAMAGLLSGVFKSPLTGIFLIAEITGGYVLFVPLMIVAALSYFVSNYFEPHSVFVRDLALTGQWAPTHERDWHILKNMQLERLVETNFRVLHPDMKLREFVGIIAKSRRNVFPVVDEEGALRGIILLDDVRELMFDQEKYDTLTVAQLMHHPPATVNVDEAMESVMKKFDQNQAWNLPVLDNGRYRGFVSKSSVFNAYRQDLIERSRRL